MAATIDPGTFKEALIILGSAAVVIPVFYRLKLSPVLGFLLVGMAVGPFGLGAFATQYPALSWVTIPNHEDIELVAEFGVVFLMFMIGLELSFERLRTMRNLVFGLGSVQLILSSVAIALLCLLLGMQLVPAVIIGVALAMSSTAVVVQVLSEEKRLGTSVGRSSFSVLLFQDIAVVPILFGVSMLALDVEGGILGRFGIALGQAAFAVVALIAGGRLLLRPLFRQVAKTRSPELFMAACLLVIMGTSLITAIAGLSAAMGALIAGLLLAETEYRRQIEVLIEPFKGLLVGVFLISVGMTLDLVQVVQTPVAVVIAATGLVALKALIVAPAARLFGLSWLTGIQAGLLLGAGGEFSFVVINLAVGEGLIPAATGKFALLAAAITMASIPLLSKLGKMLEQRLPSSVDGPIAQIAVPDDETPRVIIAGFGRVGEVVASMLDTHNVPYVAIDSDIRVVTKGRDNGQRVYYGDMKSVDFLRRCHLDTARAVVITMDSRTAVDQVVAVARAERKDLQIIARAKDARHAAHLYRMGVSHAVPETIEASLQLSEAVLVDVGVAMGPVIASIHEKRSEFQAQIQEAAPEGTEVIIGRRRLRDVQTATD
ncbi:MAG: cation:proton antiporter [Alphaproteobacteria bacterium]|nr:cation:proton antiporter [Alphaproteobacteria bacterium]